MKPRLHITEVRRITDADRARRAEFGFDTPADLEWIAIDNRGYGFMAASEAEARELADEYHHPRHTSRERGRVEHPERAR